MATLEEIRNDYPQYGELSDEELANRLYKKFYMDKLPREEFYKRIKYTPESAKRVRGVIKDIGQGIGDIPGALGHMAVDLPQEAIGAAAQLFTDPTRFVKSKAAGAAKGGTSVLNIPSQVEKYLREKELFGLQPTEDPTFSGYPAIDWNKYFGIEGRRPGDALIQGSASMAPALIAGGPGGILGESAAMGVQEIGSGQNPITTFGSMALFPKVLEGAAAAPQYAYKGARKAFDFGSALKDALTKDKLPGEAREIQEIANTYNIPTLAGDLDPKGIADKLTRSSEKLPIISTKDIRAKQREGARGAAERVEEDYKKQMVEEEFGGPREDGLNRLEEIAKGSGKRAKAAREMLENMKESGEDWNTILKTGGNVQLLLNKIKADKLYDTVEALASKQGNVEIAETIKEIDQSIAELKKLPETNKKEIAVFNGLKRDLLKTSEEVPPSKILEASGKPAIPGVPSTVSARPLKFKELRKIRGSLSNKISDYYAGKYTLVGKDGVQFLEQIRDAIGKDLETFATTNGPALKNAWKTADTYYKEKVIPYRDTAIKNALKEERGADEIFKQFIKSGGAEGDFGTARATKLFNALDPKGQAAVRYGILKLAKEKALNEKGEFSPAKYATNLKKLEASRSVFFKGSAKAEVAGLQKLMRHLDGVSRIKAPETGVQTMPLLIGLGAYFTGLGIPALVGSYGLRWLVSSAKGKRLLINLSAAKEGTPSYNIIIKNIDKELANVIAKSAKATQTNKESE